MPFLSLRRLFDFCGTEIMDAVQKVAEAGNFIGGSEVSAFESEFSSWVGHDLKTVGCGNGTDAIRIAAQSLRLAPGSEAVVPAMTFIATVEALLHAGISVRLVDVLEDSWLIDSRLLEQSITEKTKVIVPVHLYGQMPRMDEIRTIADNRKCYIIEDASQAHGARWRGMPPGYWGDLATYSFFPGKNLGAFGDAGAVTAKNEKLLEYCSAFGKHGGNRKYVHNFVGTNSRLDALQAAVLRVKLKYLNQWNERRRLIAATYQEELRDLKGLRLPKVATEATSVYHLYVVLVDDRDAFQAYLNQHGIETGVHYPAAIHQLPAFRDYSFSRQSFPVAERLAKHGVSLPMCPFLKQEEIGQVCDVVRRYFARG